MSYWDKFGDQRIPAIGRLLLNPTSRGVNQLETSGQSIPPGMIQILHQAAADKEKYLKERGRAGEQSPINFSYARAVFISTVCQGFTQGRNSVHFEEAVSRVATACSYYQALVASQQVLYETEIPQNQPDLRKDLSAIFSATLLKSTDPVIIQLKTKLRRPYQEFERRWLTLGNQIRIGINSELITFMALEAIGLKPRWATVNEDLHQKTDIVAPYPVRTKGSSQPIRYIDISVQVKSQNHQDLFSISGPTPDYPRQIIVDVNNQAFQRNELGTYLPQLYSYNATKDERTRDFKEKFKEQAVKILHI
ncbi:MAG: hypothetical protein WC686_01980 [Candidatus Shapirobacteria bacterium]|jgi:hypothetical protein